MLYFDIKDGGDEILFFVFVIMPYLSNKGSTPIITVFLKYSCNCNMCGSFFRRKPQREKTQGLSHFMTLWRGASTSSRIKEQETRRHQSHPRDQPFQSSYGKSTANISTFTTAQPAKLVEPKVELHFFEMMTLPTNFFPFLCARLSAYCSELLWTHRRYERCLLLWKR